MWLRWYRFRHRIRKLWPHRAQSHRLYSEWREFIDKVDHG